DAVDLFGRDDADAPRNRVGPYLHGKMRPLLGGKLLRIVDARMTPADRKNHRTGNDRPRERRHARFIDSGDARDACRPDLLLEAKQMTQALALGTIGAPALVDRGENRLGSAARIDAKSGLDVLRQRAAFVDV